MLRYEEVIVEDVKTLLECEGQQGYAKVRDRIRLLRLLKSGQARSLGQAAAIIGISEVGARKLLKVYLQEGLRGLCRWRYGGNHRKLSLEQQQHLVQYLTEHPNQCGSQADIGTYIMQTFGVQYSQPGISYMCKRNKIKHKTARPRNTNASQEQQQAYKKNSPRQ